jgi:pyruvate dehydrogenase E1 component beta subunit
VAIGKARTARTGKDISIVTYGAMVAVSLAAADMLAEDGVDAEVVDLRSLQPWDEAAVLESLARTHRLVVCHEAVEAFGVGAEIVARLADIGFDELDGPLVRVGAPFMPPPFAKSLEDWYRPDAGRIVAAVKRAIA